MSDRFDAAARERRAQEAVERVRRKRAAIREGMGRLAVIVNGKRLGSVRLEALPDFCGALGGCRE